MKKILGSVFSKEKAADGAVTPFQAVCTALAGTVMFFTIKLLFSHFFCAF